MNDERLTTFDSSFAHNYTVSIQPELVGNVNVIEFPSTGRHRSESLPESLLVRVEPQGRSSWIGLFRGGGLSRVGKTGVYTWPSPYKLCVACAGSTYLITAHDPKSYDELDAAMITDILPLVERELIIIADPWEVWAYNHAGLAWRTGRIAIDGLRLTGTRGEHLEGMIDSLEDDDVPFQINLETGHVEGGFRK